MLDQAQIEEQRIIIERELLLTEREGMKELLTYMRSGGFYTQPASTRYHGCYEGGLAKHSLSVKANLSHLGREAKLMPIQLSGIATMGEAIVITTLLHDLCKMGSYQRTKKPDSKQKYSWIKGSPKGHALLSLVRIQTYIELTEMEVAMIQFHMGIYGSQECMYDKGEYMMRPDGMFKAYNKWPLVKFIYFADEMAAAQERAEEGI